MSFTPQFNVSAVNLSAGIMLFAVGAVLSWMGIPFGKGIIVYIAYALMGAMARITIKFLETVYDVKYYLVISEDIKIPLPDVIYYVVIATGMLVLVIASRKRAISMLQALAGYSIGFTLDIATIWGFISDTIGSALRFITMYDFIAQMVISSSEGVANMVNDVVASAIKSYYASFTPFVGDLAWMFAVALLTATIAFLRWVASLYNAYVSKMIVGLSSTIASGIEEGEWLVLITIILANMFGFTVLYVYAVVWMTSAVCYVYIFALYVAAKVVEKITMGIVHLLDTKNLVTGAGIGEGIGNILAFNFLKDAISSIGGRPYRELEAMLFSGLTTIIVYIIGFQYLYPLIFAIVIAFILGNVYTASRLIIGIPKRFISRYISALFTLVMFTSSIKLLSGMMGYALIVAIEKVPDFVRSVVDMTIGWLLLHDIKEMLIATVSGYISGFLRYVGQTLLQFAQDP